MKVVIDLICAIFCFAFIYVALNQFYTFLKIFYFKNGWERKSLLKMYFGWRFSSSEKVNRIEAFPLSYFLHKIDSSDYEAESEEVKVLYQQKYKYEKLLWLLFAISLLSIPLMEYIIT
jgi:hypothetical protein